MKAIKTVLSLVFIVVTIAVIVYDAQTQKHKPVKADSSKVDSVSHQHTKK